jgi:hypothetical protein
VRTPCYSCYMRHMEFFYRVIRPVPCSEKLLSQKTQISFFHRKNPLLHLLHASHGIFFQSRKANARMYLNVELFNRVIPLEVRWMIYELHERDYLSELKHRCMNELLLTMRKTKEVMHPDEYWIINGIKVRMMLVSPRTSLWLRNCCTNCKTCQNNPCWHRHILSDHHE